MVALNSVEGRQAGAGMGTGSTMGNGLGGAGGERPRFLGVDEMQKALREAGTQLRETHERNERQLQVVSGLFVGVLGTRTY